MANMGAIVIRCRRVTEDRFYFSPLAVAVFESLIEFHQAAPCNPPRTRELVPSQTSRLTLGFKTRWEPFVPLRAVARGIPPITSRRNLGGAA
jgi:hypothetical protein